jgi:hypothetical protein
LISATFQVKSWFQPNICFRKPSTVASLGSVVVEPAVAGLVVWAKPEGIEKHRTAITSTVLRERFQR